jgi:hypothetical protein
MKVKLLWILAMGIVGCGDLPQTAPTEAAMTAAGSDNRGPKGDKGDRGLSCMTEDTEDGAMVVCEDGTRAQILNGKNGPQGEQGARGEAGEQGLAGVSGADGTDGLNGLDGAEGPQGEQGVQGIQGEAGTAAAQIPVEDVNGNLIGHLFYMDTAGFAVTMAGGLRAKVSNLGWIETMRTYFSEAGCQGVRRHAKTNGQFGNFWTDEFAADGTFWVIASDNLGGFSYASKEDGDGICDDGAGSVTHSFAITEGVNIDINLPFSNPHIGGLD